MKEGEVETVATADLETIKNYGARPIKQIILMQPAFPTYAVASQDSPFCFHNPVSILQAFTSQS